MGTKGSSVTEKVLKGHGEGLTTTTGQTGQGTAWPPAVTLFLA